MTKAYVQAIANSTSATPLLDGVLTNCVKAVPPGGELELVDHRYFSGTTEAAEYVLSISCPDAFAVVTEAVRPTIASSSGSVFIAVFPLPEDFPDLAVSDVELTYYRDETKVDGFIHSTDSCVQLVHKPTGVNVRCQAHRNRALNYAEAISLLQAKLSVHRGTNHAV